MKVLTSEAGVCSVLEENRNGTPGFSPVEGGSPCDPEPFLERKTSTPVFCFGTPKRDTDPDRSDPDLRSRTTEGTHPVTQYDAPHPRMPLHPRPLDLSLAGAPRPSGRPSGA